jgi:hypothetical protein
MTVEVIDTDEGKVQVRIFPHHGSFYAVVIAISGILMSKS